MQSRMAPVRQQLQLGGGSWKLYSSDGAEIVHVLIKSVRAPSGIFQAHRGRKPVGRVSSARRTSIVQSPDGALTSFALIRRWSYFFLQIKSILFKCDRAGNVLAPSCSRTGTARHKIIFRVLDGAGTVHVEALDGSSFVGPAAGRLACIRFLFR